MQNEYVCWHIDSLALRWSKSTSILKLLLNALYCMYAIQKRPLCPIFAKIQFELRPSHQTLKRCPSGWGKGLRCCPSLRYFIHHVCQNKLDNERSLLAKHKAVRPIKYLVWQRNGSKNGVPSFDYL